MSDLSTLRDRSMPPTVIEQTLSRIESLLTEKSTLLDEYSVLWARYASREMQEMHRQLEIANIRERIRTAREAAGFDAKKTELDEMVRLDPSFRELERALIEGRARWARCQQAMGTLDLRLRLELARIRLSADLQAEVQPLDLDS